MVGKLLRHLLAVAILPFSVTVLIPLWIARRYSTSFTLATGGLLLALQFGGLVVLAVGLLLFLSSLRRFATVGQGTLAPWDPPKHLVVRGPYRFVRNPMISGVIFILAGEEMILMSRPHVVWALIFLGLNLVYIPLFEEPLLRARFGESYHEYCQNVPRIFPRLRPWSPNHEQKPGGLRGEMDKPV
jgi:protein-S-isoprenylcysteine O-methyltransferase Ste14